LSSYQSCQSIDGSYDQGRGCATDFLLENVNQLQNEEHEEDEHQGFIS
jgi:hypothetical protein